jgi:2-polyprenyl-3-methyl-5-hydroxy-6-metoxy-1,4-benzoquinol methylase
MHHSERFWDRMAGSFDKEEARDEQRDLKALEKTQGYLRTSDVVLDYGCATGSKTLRLAASVREMHGIDLSSRMIDLARAKAAEQHAMNVEFWQATLFDGRLKPESYDAILAFNLLHLLDDLHAAAHQINTLLKPGGLFISATICRSQRNRLLRWPLALAGTLHLIPPVRLIETAELDQIISSQGFQLVDTERILHSFGVQYFVAARKV